MHAYLAYAACNQTVCVIRAHNRAVRAAHTLCTYAHMNQCVLIYTLCVPTWMYVKLFAFDLAGQERQPSRFPVQRKAFGKISYEIQTLVNGEWQRLCFFPGQLRRKQLYMSNAPILLLYIRMYAYTVRTFDLATLNLSLRVFRYVELYIQTWNISDMCRDRNTQV